jgi:uncharacterized protein YdhG (YjbR/CyaY superfamily)
MAGLKVLALIAFAVMLGGCCPEDHEFRHEASRVRHEIRNSMREAHDEIERSRREIRSGMREARQEMEQGRREAQREFRRAMSEIRETFDRR